MTRAALLDALAAHLAGLHSECRARVAVDGPDAAGKTSLADELAPRVAALGRPVLRASVDDFHRPAAARLARGDLSPEGCYHDAFDHPALRRLLLAPLAPGGDGRVRRACFDLRADRPVDAPVEPTASDVLLLCDGVFLQRPELADCWELTVYLDVDAATVLDRAAVRDAGLLGGVAAVRQRYTRRYLPAQALYRAEADPVGRADVLIDHRAPAHPRLLRAPWSAAP